jgi:hypothetical protein
MLDGWDRSPISFGHSLFGSVAAANTVMVMPYCPAVPTIAAVTVGTTMAHSPIVACTIHVAFAVIAHATMIHSGAASRHRVVTASMVHAAATMFVHRLGARHPVSTTVRAIRRRAGIHLRKGRRGKRQHADSGDCHHFHGISPRDRRGGAQMMDDRRRRMFRLRRARRPTFPVISALPRFSS